VAPITPGGIGNVSVINGGRQFFASTAKIRIGTVLQQPGPISPNLSSPGKQGRMAATSRQQSLMLYGIMALVLAFVVLLLILSVAKPISGQNTPRRPEEAFSLLGRKVNVHPTLET